MGFLVANFYFGDVWVGDLVNEQIAEKQYRDWLKRKESLSYIFKSDVGQIDNLKEEMKVVDNQHPRLLRRYLSKEICAETLIILNAVQKKCLFKYWEVNIRDPVWETVHNKLVKLSPFVQFEEDKYKSMLTDIQEQCTLT
jgi:hypothetical protein